MQNITILFSKNSKTFFNSIKSLYLLKISLLPLLDKPKRTKNHQINVLFFCIDRKISYISQRVIIYFLPANNYSSDILI